MCAAPTLIYCSNHRHDLSNYETPANDAKPEEHDKTAFVESSNVQEKLVSLLREQLGGCEEIDVPELRSALAAADRCELLCGIRMFTELVFALKIMKLKNMHVK